MENSAVILNINDGLKTYAGRDACIRMVAYFFLFLYGILKQIEILSEYLFYEGWFESNFLTELKQSCLTISKHFSTTRLILRFFDDIPTLLKFFNFLDSTKNKVIYELITTVFSNL